MGESAHRAPSLCSMLYTLLGSESSQTFCLGLHDRLPSQLLSLNVSMYLFGDLVRRLVLSFLQKKLLVCIRRSEVALRDLCSNDFIEVFRTRSIASCRNT
ncbi:hypothetical protein FRC12_004399 [Ceratobasidium sp. 428]|nr:hypothetical protein FRC12_004399 [Ceratobasidium sp. 428]